MRGGSSRGLFFNAEDLPVNLESESELTEFARTLARGLGSPDPYLNQIDGVGGATSSTSKIVIVSRSEKDDSELDYLFGAVSIESGRVDFSGTCGNLASAVVPFGLHSGLIQVNDPSVHTATFRVRQVNNNRVFAARIAIKDGFHDPAGSFYLSGIAHPSSEIKLIYFNPGGGATGSLFPTGNCIDQLQVKDAANTEQIIEATLIDAGNPTVFIKAGETGLKATETASELNEMPEKLTLIENLRREAARLMGLEKKNGQIDEAIPKIAFVSTPRENETGIQLNARIISMNRAHHAFTGTGAISLAAAAAIKGTIPYALRLDRGSPDLVFAHAAGTMKLSAGIETGQGGPHVKSVSLSRSARVLFDGCIYIPPQ